MSVSLPADRMPEAEVSLRLAFSFLAAEGSDGAASVAIDGAQVRVHGRQVFPIAAFLREAGWEQVSQHGKNAWQGEYRRDGRAHGGGVERYAVSRRVQTGAVGAARR